MMIINWPFKRKRLREYTPSVIPSKGQQLRDNVMDDIMDDITYGQWGKKYRDSNDDSNDDSNNNNNTDHSQAKNNLDPYNIQPSFRKMADKLSKRL